MEFFLKLFCFIFSSRSAEMEAKTSNGTSKISQLRQLRHLHLLVRSDWSGNLLDGIESSNHSSSTSTVSGIVSSPFLLLRRLTKFHPSSTAMMPKVVKEYPS